MTIDPSLTLLALVKFAESLDALIEELEDELDAIKVAERMKDLDSAVPFDFKKHL